MGSAESLLLSCLLSFFYITRPTFPHNLYVTKSSGPPFFRYTVLAHQHFTQRSIPVAPATKMNAFWRFRLSRPIFFVPICPKRHPGCSPQCFTPRSSGSEIPPLGTELLADESTVRIWMHLKGDAVVSPRPDRAWWKLLSSSPGH